jgi:hypothetical protein
VRFFGLKSDSILATAFMKFKSKPNASAARSISWTGVPSGTLRNAAKAILAGFSDGGISEYGAASLNSAATIAGR